MPALKHNSLLFALLLAATSLFAQQGNSENVLRLRSGFISLPDNAVAYFEQKHQRSATTYQYIQFVKIPDARQMEQLENQGIALLQYLSNRTYIATIKPNNTFPKSLLDNIRSVVHIKANDKIAPELLDIYNEESPFGKKQNITFLLQHYSDFATAELVALLQKQNIIILKQQPTIQALTVSASKDQLMEIAQWPMVANLESIATDIQPEDELGHSHHRSNLLNSAWNQNMHFNGEGVHIAIGDDGFIGPHIDLKNRTEQADLIGDQSGTHGEMVAGILTGAGNINPANKGIADGATLHVLREFEAVEQGATLFVSRGVVITNTAYSDGCNRGYTTLAQLADHQSNTIPALIHVFSAGNAGTDDCEYGAGNGWGNITGGVKTGKNVLAVANLNVEGERVASSSRGPSNDGRIKPDIAAFGEGQIGLAPDNEYQLGSGTSAAAPVISGVLAQLYQVYREKYNNTNPSSALLKACLLNSADDLGNPGPDYSFGWGKVNAFNAFKILDNENWWTGTATQDSEETFQITVPENVKELRVMIYWHDKAASPVSAKSLVNDIDMTVATPDGTLHQPWVLTHEPDAALLQLPAIKGGDHLNNMEQVLIENPVAGNYEVHVSGYEIPFTQQDFYVVYQYTTNDLQLTYPNGGERFAPADNIQIHWDAFGNTENFNLVYSTDNGLSWLPIATVDADVRQYNWTLPELQTGAALVRVQRGNQFAESQQSFSIYDSPADFQIEKVCPDFVRLTWEAVDNADHYIIYQLGEQYMDSIANTTATSIDIPILTPSKEYWFAISAQSVSGALSKRTNAIATTAEVFNCTPTRDMSLESITNPAASSFSDCFSQDIPVSVNIRNTGLEVQSDIPLYYQYNNEPVVAAVLAGTLPSNVTVNYTFDIPISTSLIGQQQLKVWTGLAADEASYNDTLVFLFDIVAGTVYGLPFQENFDDFEPCTVDASCAVSCLLENDWRNTMTDQIDWRVHSGQTATFGTGPDNDQNRGTEAGSYLYLEAGSGCFQQSAILNSPCINLNNTITPTLSFWYHCYGADMGELHIDLFDGMQWHFNISNAIVGNQGNQWQKATVNLTAFANQLVTIRFRAKTGDGFLTDMAIDNIAVFDANTAPTAEFIVNKTKGCPDEVIHFKDNSLNEGSDWVWTFEPPTVSFLQNTDAQTQHPIVRFEEPGLYSVSLTTSNDFGVSDIQKTDFIFITEGMPLPYVQDFEGDNFPPADWISQNTDNAIGWMPADIIGKDGQANSAAFMNNFSYNITNEEDALYSPLITLTNTTTPLLRFDYAYVSYSNNFSDKLTVTLSTDCGNTFEFTLFEKSGNDLATAANQNKAWAPKKIIDWKTAIIDLSDFAGQSVSLRFLNTCQFGNNLYLDNIAIYEAGDFPITDFAVENQNNTICVGESLSFSNTTVGTDINNYYWSFGNNNMPPEANTGGAHTVIFTEPGSQVVSFVTSNDLGSDVLSQSIEVIAEPVIDFSVQQNGQAVQITNNSLYGGSYLWDFGDGQSSTAANPSHSYDDAGTYAISLTATNECGSSQLVQSVDITSSTAAPSATFAWSILPNPASDKFLIKTNNNTTTNLKYRIFSIAGKMFLEEELYLLAGAQFTEVDISTLPVGLYMVQIDVAGQLISQRLVVMK